MMFDQKCEGWGVK